MGLSGRKRKYVMRQEVSAENTPCVSCRHYQMRGGIVFPRTLECVRLEPANGDRAISGDMPDVLMRILRTLAEISGRCAEFAPYEEIPDSYLSEDLPL